MFVLKNLKHAVVKIDSRLYPNSFWNGKCFKIEEVVTVTQESKSDMRNVRKYNEQSKSQSN